MSLNRKIVLLVDDESTVRQTLRIYLEDLGAFVLEAEGAAEALKLASQSPLHIDLLLTDVLLPYVNGRDLANKIAQERPDIKVLFISGYPFEVLGHHGLCPQGADLLLKPFSKQELGDRVHSVMEFAPVWNPLKSSQGPVSNP